LRRKSSAQRFILFTKKSKGNEEKHDPFNKQRRKSFDSISEATKDYVKYRDYASFEKLNKCLTEAESVIENSDSSEKELVQYIGKIRKVISPTAKKIDNIEKTKVKATTTPTMKKL